MGSDGEWVGGDGPPEGQPKRDTGRTSPDSGAGPKQGAGMQLGAHFPTGLWSARSSDPLGDKERCPTPSVGWAGRKRGTHSLPQSSEIGKPWGWVETKSWSVSWGKEASKTGSKWETLGFLALDQYEPQKASPATLWILSVLGHMNTSGNQEAEACVTLKRPPDDSGSIKSLPIISQMNSCAFFYGLL